MRRRRIHACETCRSSIQHTCSHPCGSLGGRVHTSCGRYRGHRRWLRWRDGRREVVSAGCKRVRVCGLDASWAAAWACPRRGREHLVHCRQRRCECCCRMLIYRSLHNSGQLARLVRTLHLSPQRGDAIGDVKAGSGRVGTRSGGTRRKGFASHGARHHKLHAGRRPQSCIRTKDRKAKGRAKRCSRCRLDPCCSCFSRVERLVHGR